MPNQVQKRNIPTQPGNRSSTHQGYQRHNTNQVLNRNNPNQGQIRPNPSQYQNRNKATTYPNNPKSQFVKSNSNPLAFHARKGQGNPQILKMRTIGMKLLIKGNMDQINTGGYGNYRPQGPRQPNQKYYPKK